LLSERFGERFVVLNPPALLEGLLRGRLILPEVGRGDARLEVGQFLPETGFVKAPSEGRRRGWSGLRKRELARQTSWGNG
jgi:hypothetical protein